MSEKLTALQAVDRLGSLLGAQAALGTAGDSAATGQMINAVAHTLQVSGVHELAAPLIVRLIFATAAGLQAANAQLSTRSK